jgi:hypothetical protein
MVNRAAILDTHLAGRRTVFDMLFAKKAIWENHLRDVLTAKNLDRTN